MDLDKLITLVQDRKPLWDLKNKQYHNRDIARKLWNEIAEELECSSHIAKSKWQSLRDNFREEHAKLGKRTIGDGASDKPVSQWKYYIQLIFLTDVFESRKMDSNVPPHDGDDRNTENFDTEDLMETQIENCNQHFEFHVEDEPTTSTTIPKDKSTKQVNPPNTSSAPSSSKPTIERQRGIGKKQAISQLLSLEQKKLEHIKMVHEKANTSDNEGEDYHFLMSLLPHLQEVPKRRKLAVRLKLQVVLDEQVFQDSPRTGNNSVSSYSRSIPSAAPSPSYPIHSPENEYTCNSQDQVSAQRAEQISEESLPTYADLTEFILLK